MGTETFTATLEASPVGKGGHWVVVPDAVMSDLTDKARAKVKATFNGVPYRGSIVRYSGAYVLGVTKAIIKQTGASPGDPLEVSVKLDTAERTVALPPELQEAFTADPTLRTSWEALSYTRRKERARALEEARRPETRARRLEGILRELSG
jgi:Domain of unknown function (DUF1905)/Bacteriocin-protection, YdeI or OmpD-Associated